MEQPKVIITMTSWKMRINEVSKCIYHFLTRQIEKPDIFYLSCEVKDASVFVI